MSDPAFSTVDIKGLDDFVQKNNLGKFRHSPVLYRGQPHDWPLIPKIARDFDRSKDDIRTVLARESWLLEEFARQGMGIDTMPATQCDLISKAQHYGLPTRLLDWTQNAIAALWFAVGESAKDVSAPQPIVWRFETDEGDFEDRPEFLNTSRTIVFRPNHVAPRIRAQAGWFTVHRLPKKGPIAFEKHARYSARLTKFRIIGSRNAVRKKLNDLGINRATLYPELNNLCSHLEWESQYVVATMSDRQLDDFAQRFLGKKT